MGPKPGSRPASLVAWSLLITNLDPLRYGLLFERFLNPERVSMPDFDIDFCQERRGEVIRYVQETYGDDRVAQIITFGTLPRYGRCCAMLGRVMQLLAGSPGRPAGRDDPQQIRPTPTTLAKDHRDRAALLQGQGRGWTVRR